jgi:hypothetical protein
LTSTDSFVALLVGILTIIGTLARISFQLGTLIARFNGHVEISDRVDADHEGRLRLLEAPQAPRRGRAVS